MVQDAQASGGVRNCLNRGIGTAFVKGGRREADVYYCFWTRHKLVRGGWPIVGGVGETEKDDSAGSECTGVLSGGWEENPTMEGYFLHSYLTEVYGEYT